MDESHDGLQVASDIHRDGLGVELKNGRDEVVAEVFRSDREKTVEVSIFVRSVPLNEMLTLLDFARERLNPFEDGTPLEAAIE